MTDLDSNATASAVDAPVQHITADNGIAYAYKRFGASPDGVPLVFLQHFRGNLDNWDPALVDAIAAGREVVLVDNVGVGGTTGTTPASVEQMANDVLPFLASLGLQRVDLFGYSLGGFVAQELLRIAPATVRRAVLAGTGPKGAPGMGAWSASVVGSVVVDEVGPAGILSVFYTGSEASQQAGQRSLGRIYGYAEGRDAEVSLTTKEAQYAAVIAWGEPDFAAVQSLTGITHPVLVLQGDADPMIPVSASHLIAGLVPGARIQVYPDAAHGSIFQYPERAAADTLEFLSAA